MLAYNTWEKQIELADLNEKSGSLDIAEATYKLALQEAEKISGNEEIRAYTLMKLARCAWSMGKAQEAEAYYLMALDIASSPEMVSSAAFDLARLYCQLNNRESSLKYYQYALHIAGCLYHPQSQELASLHNEYNQVVEYYNQSNQTQAHQVQVNQAVQAHQAPTQTVKRNNAYQSHKTKSSQDNNLSKAAQELLGRWQTALETAESEHRKGDYLRCEQSYREALGLAELCGKDTATYFSTLQRVASLVLSQGKAVEAERYLLEAYSLKMTAFGAGNVQVAEAAQELAILYFNQGILEKAEPWARRTYDIYESLTGGQDTKELACAIHNLAVLYHSKQDYAKAEPFYQRAMYMKQNLYGNGDIETINIMRGYADLLHKCHRVEEAKHLEMCASGVLSGAYATQPELEVAQNEYVPS